MVKWKREILIYTALRLPPPPLDGIYCSLNALATEILRFSYHLMVFSNRLLSVEKEQLKFCPYCIHVIPSSTQKALALVDKTSKKQNSQESRITWKYSYSIFVFPLGSLDILDTLCFVCTKTGYKLEVNSLFALQCIIHEVSSCFMVITRFGMPQLCRKHRVNFVRLDISAALKIRFAFLSL